VSILFDESRLAGECICPDAVRSSDQPGSPASRLLQVITNTGHYNFRSLFQQACPRFGMDMTEAQIDEGYSRWRSMRRGVEIEGED
jgi:hypothetical protein